MATQLHENNPPGFLFKAAFLPCPETENTTSEKQAVSAVVGYAFAHPPGCERTVGKHALTHRKTKQKKQGGKGGVCSSCDVRSMPSLTCT